MKQFSTNKIDIFNMLRGLALLCVIGCHTICVVNPSYPDIAKPSILNTPAWIAMWMFFFLSGYLLTKGFINGKYNNSIKGVLGFYVTRLIRIIPMYLFYLLIFFIFIDPLWIINNPKVIIQLLTFTYNGKIGVIGIGATWFISTIVQLYIFAPIIYHLFISKLLSAKSKIIGYLFLLTLGLAYRIIVKENNIDYYTWCYTLSFANFDIFFGGMILCSILHDSKESALKSKLKPYSILLFLAYIISYMIWDLSSSYYYYYYCPTITILLMSLTIFAFDSCDAIRPAKLSVKNCCLNPFRIIEYLGIISFTFYLFHSNIINMVLQTVKSPLFPIYIPDNHLYAIVYFGMIIICFPFSIIIHYVLEEPFDKIKNAALNRIYSYHFPWNVDTGGRSRK